MPIFQDPRTNNFGPVHSDADLLDRSRRFYRKAKAPADQKFLVLLSDGSNHHVYGLINARSHRDARNLALRRQKVLHQSAPTICVVAGALHRRYTKCAGRRALMISYRSFPDGEWTSIPFLLSKRLSDKRVSASAVLALRIFTDLSSRPIEFPEPYHSWSIDDGSREREVRARRAEAKRLVEAYPLLVALISR